MAFTGEAHMPFMDAWQAEIQVNVCLIWAEEAFCFLFCFLFLFLILTHSYGPVKLSKFPKGDK